MSAGRAATGDARPGRRELLVSGAKALRLVWRAAPGQLAGFSAITLAGGVVPVVAAWLTKIVLDRLVAPGPIGAVVGLAIGLACVGVVNAVLPQLGQYLQSEVDRRVGLRAQDELFAAVERFVGLGRFEEPAFLDRLRLAQHSARSPGQIAGAMFGLGRDAVTLVGFVASLALISPLFTVIVLVAAAPALVIELRISRQRAETMLRIEPAERWRFFYSELLTTVEAAKEIRLFDLGGYLRGRMNSQLRQTNHAHRVLDRRELGAQGALALLAALVSGGGLIWILVSAGRGGFTVGDVSVFVAAVAGVQGALNGLVHATAETHRLLLMFGHYTAVTGAGRDLPSPATPRELRPLRDGIELRDVWFRYSDDHPWVLRGINLSIPRGATVALVGRNGAGKSTLVKLLCRFYDPTKGAILWDGVDIRDVPIDRLRARIGAVFQDFMAYDFSAADNIAVGDLTARGDQGRIEAAARHAGIHDTVTELPRGYDTLLTRMFSSDSIDGDPQTGVTLSGGQWQRLALARALVRDERDLMILDEPSAGLDAEAEHDIHTRLRRLRAGRTNVLITHRLGAVREADVIVVLSGDEIVEQGDHARLLAADGVYARMFTLQAAGYAALSGEPG
ncbi:ABC transporter ATP-binding protein [Nonomuraea cavernae]|uniref:Multidrug ABC transporter permease n=1 Tax=Nonomuraea cavernae TaxID=2045107 RepID=A0A918DP87_9ACTN|nr:ABC transporter ATP-binding protein [Nonomuraea cavernae]MCA2185646.1 ABC transporter ATP-binding protein/permease [Nonomuraea cavernae]GGO78152.1 multidrug ABC transporter permease [Nonomuraea cavernae]